MSVAESPWPRGHTNQWSGRLLIQDLQETHLALALLFHPKGISYVAARDKGKEPGSFTSGMLFPQFLTHFARNNLRRGSAEFSLKKLWGLKIPGVTNVCVGVTKTRSYSWACVMECGTENWESQRREWRHWPAGSRASSWKPRIQGNNHLIEHRAQQMPAACAFQGGKISSFLATSPRTHCGSTSTLTV